jgi:hypothetical protein
MQKKTRNILVVILFISSFQMSAQVQNADSICRKFFIGSSLFVLANLTSDDNAPDFVQVNFGYRFSKKNAISVELKTWKYAWPLGIPYGESFEAPEEKFPGYIREHGFALVYQRFWWKGLYTGVHVMSAWQSFVNEQGLKVDKGFQVFNTYRMGYHLSFFNKRFFVEPSIAITHRPFYTEMPESFKQLNDKWSNIFIGEPGLHIGYNF